MILIKQIALLINIYLLVTAKISEGNRISKRQTTSSQNAGNQATSIENLCDIASPLIIYCYCDTVEKDEAEEGNCWIFNDTSEDEYSDVWEGFSTQTKIRHLTLHLRPDGTLKHIPTIAVLHLPDLQWFEVQYATIFTAHPYSFGNSSSIEKISLARNSIKTLKTNSFANLPKLTSLTLSENHLTQINRNVFVNLPKLDKLFIDRNNITNIEDFAFAQLKNLKELELFSNQIRVIVPETFEGLYKLQRLDLHKNWIEVLGDMTFKDLKNLNVLDLKGNSIKYIAPKTFHGLKNLQKLVLQDNKLLTLGANVFKHFEGLLFLDLRHNVLETITKETIHPLLPNLKKEQMNIYLEGNVFRCDTRLLWIFGLYNSTKSAFLKRELDDVHCYLEAGALPQRLSEGIDTTPSFEFTTMGIGPRVSLMKLRPSELPDPLVRTPATYTQENCDEDQKVDKEKKPSNRIEVNSNNNKTRTRGGGNSNRNRVRGRGRKNHRHTTEQPIVISDSNQQNDMASPQSVPEEKNDNSSPGLSHEVQPASPVQKSRPYSEEENWSSGCQRIKGFNQIAFVVACICFSNLANKVRYY